MKRTILLAAVLTMFCTSCTNSKTESETETEKQLPTRYVQEIEHLHADNSRDYPPQNYSYHTGLWIPYTYYDEYMSGKSEEEFRSIIREKLTEAKTDGVNTVYLHVHPFGDAYYHSEIFPKGSFLDGEYDPLQIMLEEAHKLSLSAHAWINPLRCQTVEEMKQLPDTFILKTWTNDTENNFVKIVNDRWYLNPAYDETIKLVSQCVNEILNNYNVDGIHIDDYFYPTTAEDFDKEAFEASGNTNLTAWRTENCTRLVKAIYDTVKAYDSRVLFGISPQGNINSNYTTQYADVRLWGGESGYCDYIVPQLYFGFKNETCPFEPTLREWENIVKNSSVSLVIGVAAYKLGKEDKWAGAAGEQEWVENPDIIDEQIESVKKSSANGYSLYK